MDFFSCEGRKYLVVPDKYSGWAEVYDFNRGVSMEDMVKKLLSWSTTLRTPNRLTSYNGLQFKSAEFKEFCES